MRHWHASGSFRRYSRRERQTSRPLCRPTVASAVFTSCDVPVFTVIKHGTCPPSSIKSISPTTAWRPEVPRLRVLIRLQPEPRYEVQGPDECPCVLSSNSHLSSAYRATRAPGCDRSYKNTTHKFRSAELGKTILHCKCKKPVISRSCKFGSALRNLVSTNAQNSRHSYRLC